MRQKFTKETFISEAKMIWGNKYDYSLIVSVNSKKEKVPIICPIHGVFYKDYIHHVQRKQGCPECVGRKRYNTKEFIEKVQQIHGDAYDYSKVQYINNKTEVTLICPQHGEFQIMPSHLLSGEGCPKCRYIKSANSKRRSLDEVIKLAREIHGDKYDYSLITDYKNDRIRYPIICPIHGVFYQTFNNHIKGKQGCPQCGAIKSHEEKKYTFEEFVERANEVHNHQYQYIKESYKSMSDYVDIICSKHGVFKQKASNHVNLGYGCPRCAYVESDGENELYAFIAELVGKENVIHNDNKTIAPLQLDVFVPAHEIAFEYNGLRWHSELYKENDYHLTKTNMCNEKNIRLFHIFEDEWIYKKEIVKSMIRNSLSLTNQRIFARKCSIKEVSSAEAKTFLNENHLQGFCPSQIRYGLYYNNELYSLMTFGKTRHFVGGNNHEWELLRFCNKLNTNVIGGASKLLKHFINKYNPQNIVSYADKRWSTGKLYDTLGFVKYNESKPNYYYIVKNKRVYRFNLRKSVLIKKYGCDPEMTEREFCKKQQWYRIYDCGCLCYELDLVKKMEKSNKNDFIEKARKIHGDKYDYSKVNYLNNRTPVCIICPIHGEFFQSPNSHLNGNGCPACGKVKRLTEEDFIKRATEVHNGKYTYENCRFVSTHKDVWITCPIHGGFWQNAKRHLNGQGCPECGKMYAQTWRKFKYANFIEESKKRFGDVYEFPNIESEYENSHSKITIVCKKCQTQFIKIACDHLTSSNGGCPKCFAQTSSGEIALLSDLRNMLGDNVIIEQHRRDLLSKYSELDFYLPQFNLAIEYNGLYWHTELSKVDKNYHLWKTEDCKKHNISLIQIFEDEYVNHRDIVLSKLAHILHIQQNLPKVYGRKCKIIEIDKNTAEQFLNTHHIQGFVSSSIYLGAFFKKQLVGVMQFKRITKNSNDWELTRFASDNNILCCGVGGKLFKYFTDNYNPYTIKSFADRRWTTNEENNIYLQLGFHFGGYTKPEYRYFKASDGIIRQHKFGFRKNTLHKKYGLALTLTESEMCKQLGYLKIYDCGLIKYIWNKKI